MAFGSLLVLLDDIAAVLDDVSVMTKVAAKKTAGVLGDDLAVNAEKVTGVHPERELPVVWAVAKGSMRNKVILVPAALLIAAFAPMLITPLMVIGGLYLCFEGGEKVLHVVSAAKREHQQAHIARIQSGENLVLAEEDKIKGAIRTDFILSAEIIVLTLGVVADQTQAIQIAVVSLVAVLMTVGVYGLVALIVKIDDIGLHLLTRSEDESAVSARLGRGLLWIAPKVMSFLSVAGTVAMFLVGGGILAHAFPDLHHTMSALLSRSGMAWATWLLTPLAGIVVGLILALLMAALGQVVKNNESP
jgi:hypothetical protein